MAETKQPDLGRFRQKARAAGYSEAEINQFIIANTRTASTMRGPFGNQPPAMDASALGAAGMVSPPTTMMPVKTSERPSGRYGVERMTHVTPASPADASAAAPLVSIRPPSSGSGGDLGEMVGGALGGGLLSAIVPEGIPFSSITGSSLGSAGGRLIGEALDSRSTPDAPIQITPEMLARSSRAGLIGAATEGVGQTILAPMVNNATKYAAKRILRSGTGATEREALAMLREGLPATDAGIESFVSRNDVLEAGMQEAVRAADRAGVVPPPSRAEILKVLQDMYDEQARYNVTNPEIQKELASVIRRAKSVLNGRPSWEKTLRVRRIMDDMLDYNQINRAAAGGNQVVLSGGVEKSSKQVADYLRSKLSEIPNGVRLQGYEKPLTMSEMTELYGSNAEARRRIIATQKKPESVKSILPHALMGAAAYGTAHHLPAAAGVAGTTYLLSDPAISSRIALSLASRAGAGGSAANAIRLGNFIWNASSANPEGYMTPEQAAERPRSY